MTSKLQAENPTHYTPSKIEVKSQKRWSSALRRVSAKRRKRTLAARCNARKCVEEVGRLALKVGLSKGYFILCRGTVGGLLVLITTSAGWMGVV